MPNTVYRAAKNGAGLVALIAVAAPRNFRGPGKGGGKRFQRGTRRRIRQRGKIDTAQRIVPGSRHHKSLKQCAHRIVHGQLLFYR
jgi:hypothetical protein